MFPPDGVNLIAFESTFEIIADNLFASKSNNNSSTSKYTVKLICFSCASE